MLRLVVVLMMLISTVSSLIAREHVGAVSFAGVPVPGATVTASRDGQTLTTVTNAQGIYRFPDLADGSWVIDVEMTGFAPARIEASVSPGLPALSIPLALRSFSDLSTTIATARAEVFNPTPLPDSAATPTTAGAPLQPPPPPPDAADAMGAADGLLINGSVNNGAASPFAQAAAFGNNRAGRRSLYNGSVGIVLGNSAWDARPYSFTTARTPKPDYQDVQFLATFGGPIRIPRLTRNGPNTFIGYQRNVGNTATTEASLVPTLLERNGDFSVSRDAFGLPVTPIDPATGLPFPGHAIPADRLSAEALSLLALYPQPNLAESRFNFQAPLLTVTRDDNLQTRLTQNLNNRNALFGTLAARRIETEATSVFGLTDDSTRSNIDGNITWSRRFSPFFATRVRYDFARATTHVVPHFASRTNVLGLAGIGGTDQSPENWGPPSVTFSSGLLGLSGSEFERTAATTHGAVVEGLWNRPGHSITVGVGVRRTGFDVRGQQNGRGAFTFNGAVTGSDFADFLLGLPSASAITSGSPEKSFTGRSYEAYVTDDWRVHPGLTINAGVRWEYEAPLVEAQGRLSNLAIASDFSSATLVTQRDGGNILQPDRLGIQPRIGVAWRPIAGSSTVVRAGYGVYRNTNTYRPLALVMAQQPPFSTALSLQRSATIPLTLANGFIPTAAGAPATFAVDPEFRVGDVQNWQLLVQRDLPASLTVSAAYLGAYGRHLMQEVLPNTYPAGLSNPCPTCPAGFAYLTSNGSSMRNAMQLQVRRRLRNGLTATTQYTLAKATDDAAAFNGAGLSGAVIAQDWTNLAAERGPSNFDQRHLLTAEVQYTTGVGVQGGGLLGGLKGGLIRGWTVSTQLSAGSGLPVTPVYLSSVAGTGVTGALRASYSGAPLDAVPHGLYFNPRAFAIPASGTWGNAGRNSLRGPAQFGMSAGIARSFAWGERMTIDWRIDATNVLNRVTFSSVNAAVGGPQFGAPTRANPMRKLQSTLRLRF